MNQRHSSNDGEAKNTARLRTTIKPPQGWAMPDFGELYRYRDLMYILTTRSIAVVYRQSILGVGWAFFRPLFTAMIFTIIFGRFAGFDERTSSVAYPVFVFAGLVIWSYFATSLTSTAESVVSQSNLFTKIYFPRLILPMSAMGVATVDFAIQFLVLLIAMFYYGVSPTVAILTLPVWVAAAALTSLAIGVWLTALNVRFRDVKHIVPFFVQSLLYLTPVIYPASIVPERWQWVVNLNPMFSIVQGFRWSLLGTEPPQWGLFGMSLAITAALLVSSLVYFRRVESTFADVV